MRNTAEMLGEEQRSLFNPYWHQTSFLNSACACSLFTPSSGNDICCKMLEWKAVIHDLLQDETRATLLLSCAIHRWLVTCVSWDAMHLL